MASIVIGGESYTIPEMNFLAIERAWPYVVEATETLDPMKGPSAALAVFAAAIMEGDSFQPADFGIETTSSTTDEEIHLRLTHFFKKQLKGTEVGKVKTAMFEVLKEAGLEATEGEATQALMAAHGTQKGQPIPSPETVLDTSPSSLPPESKAEAGTG
jgi:hypothetical protein